MNLIPCNLGSIPSHTSQVFFLLLDTIKDHSTGDLIVSGNYLLAQWLDLARTWTDRMANHSTIALCKERSGEQG